VGSAGGEETSRIDGSPSTRTISSAISEDMTTKVKSENQEILAFESEGLVEMDEFWI
jgi:hypothetical protein